MSKVVLHVLINNFSLKVKNHTLSLVPKVDEPKFVTKFRPISLYNVIYIFIAKYIANRMKSVLSNS